MSTILPVDLRTRQVLSNDDLMQNFQALATLLAGGLTALNISPGSVFPSSLLGTVQAPLMWTFQTFSATTTAISWFGLDTALTYTITDLLSVASVAPGTGSYQISTSPTGATFTTISTVAGTVVGNTIAYHYSTPLAIPAGTKFVKVQLTTGNSVVTNTSILGLTPLAWD